jgi:hypothetical protein
VLCARGQLQIGDFMYVQHHAWQKGGRAASDDEDEDDEEASEGEDGDEEEDRSAFEEQEWKKKVPKYAAKKGKHKVGTGTDCVGGRRERGPQCGQIVMLAWMCLVRHIRMLAMLIGYVLPCVPCLAMYPLQGSNEGNHAWGIAQLVAVSSVATQKGKKAPDNLKVRRQATANAAVAGGRRGLPGVGATYLPKAYASLCVTSSGYSCCKRSE